ncbi:hypothetical protein MCOL2_12127 [Listeria fleischmannii FSL S10-1203]|uniref:Uncharacterized protein n=1 Tax=Listeria fleischmannii FSL S10-1203 TaxID=1265822 RepID=W7DM02_9LIST|nr:hypothetical protein MCOL2_12127 [Listeria fleischmannii FSL S10-1203]
MGKENNKLSSIRYVLVGIYLLFMIVSIFTILAEMKWVTLILQIGALSTMLALVIQSYKSRQK